MASYTVPIMKKFALLYPFLISIFIIFVGILAYLQGISFLDLMELKTIDLRFEARGQILPGPDVVLAVIDEKASQRRGCAMDARCLKVHGDVVRSFVADYCQRLFRKPDFNEYW